MPMFQEHQEPPGTSPENDRRDRSSPIPIQTIPDLIRPLGHRISEESIRTELCEGPIPDSPRKPSTPELNISNVVSDRAELIERLKRGESPTWVPNRHVRLSSRVVDFLVMFGDANQSTAGVSLPPNHFSPPNTRCGYFIEPSIIARTRHHS